MSVREDVLAVFASINIDNATEDQKLGDDLAVDSQEIVSLTCELEKRFRIAIPDDGIQRSSTVAQIIDLVAAQLGIQAEPVAAITTAGEGSLTEELMVNAPVDIVYGCLFDVRSWPRLLPHVDAIDVVYDDGRYQEFFMSVRGADGNTIRVRSIRKCTENEITFFQPEPPNFLSRHSGRWTFNATGWGRCLLRTTHEWKLNENAEALYPPQDGVTTADRVETVLRDHARLALTSWKSIIEEGRQHGVAAGTHSGAVVARV